MSRRRSQTSVESLELSIPVPVLPLPPDERPPLGQRRIRRQLVLIATAVLFAIQIAETVRLAVAVARLGAVNGLFPKDDCRPTLVNLARRFHVSSESERHPRAREEGEEERKKERREGEDQTYYARNTPTPSH